MPDTVRRYTVDQVLAFPADGNRYELVAGELLVTPAPAPRHQLIVARLVAPLGSYLSRYSDVATVFVGPGDVFWSDQDYVQPDLLVTPAGEVINSWRECRTLLLAVEVVSPGSAQYDRVTKRRLYQRVGVATYWVVDPDSRLVEVWRPGEDRPEIATEMLRWRVGPEAEELVIDLGQIFALR
jgi:Uma2 family endonuclease